MSADVTGYTADSGNFSMRSSTHSHSPAGGDTFEAWPRARLTDATSSTRTWFDSAPA